MHDLHVAPIICKIPVNHLQHARRIVIAVLQRIVYDEYLQILLGEEDYKGYHLHDDVTGKNFELVKTRNQGFTSITNMYLVCANNCTSMLYQSTTVMWIPRFQPSSPVQRFASVTHKSRTFSQWQETPPTCG